MNRRILKSVSQKTGSRRGFILMVTLILVFVVMTLGWMYLSSTLQSKNMFQVFYRDDVALLIAESAAAEWRVIKFKKNDPILMSYLVNFSGNPKLNPSPPPCTLSDLPKTKGVASELLGGTHVEVSCAVSVKDFDGKLETTTKSGKTYSMKFDKEYQGTLRLNIDVRIGIPSKLRHSKFFYEYDLKTVNLRSASAGRTGKGHSTSGSNDYVLYIRDAMNEFNNLKGQSLNKDDTTLVFAQPITGKKGKIFLGCGSQKDPGNYVFININEKMKEMMPNNPPTIVIPWSVFEPKMKSFADEIKNKINTAQKEIDDEIKKNPKASPITLDVSKVEGRIVVEYKPLLPQKGNWLQQVGAYFSALFKKFFDKFPNSKEGNKERGVSVLGAEDTDFSMFEHIEGNLRQRFLQTVIFDLDLSKVANADAQYKSIVDKELAKAQQKIEIEYRDRKIIEAISQPNSKIAELYKYIVEYEKEKKTILMSQANDMFPFKKNPGFDERNPEGILPEKSIKGNIESFFPFPFYLLRSHLFKTEQSFKESKFFDKSKNLVFLNGIIYIEDPAGISFEKGTTYKGQGVILTDGGIRLMGSFTRNEPSDGPCVLYTLGSPIKANFTEQGKIEASLIALNKNYPGTTSCVDFSGKKAEVFGNLIADRINLAQMGKNQNNSIAYDSNNLHGDNGDLYSVFLGARLRSTALVYDMP